MIHRIIWIAKIRKIKIENGKMGNKIVSSFFYLFPVFYYTYILTSYTFLSFVEILFINLIISKNVFFIVTQTFFIWKIHVYKYILNYSTLFSIYLSGQFALKVVTMLERCSEILDRERINKSHLNNLSN